MIFSKTYFIIFCGTGTYAQRDPDPFIIINFSSVVQSELSRKDQAWEV